MIKSLREKNRHSLRPLRRCIMKLVLPESMCIALNVSLDPMKRLGQVCWYPSKPAR